VGMLREQDQDRSEPVVPGPVLPGPEKNQTICMK